VGHLLRQPRKEKKKKRGGNGKKDLALLTKKTRKGGGDIVEPMSGVWGVLVFFWVFLFFGFLVVVTCGGLWAEEKRRGESYVTQKGLAVSVERTEPQKPKSWRWKDTFLYGRMAG